MIYKTGLLNDSTLVETAAKAKTKQHSRSNTMSKISLLNNAGSKYVGVKSGDL